MRRVCSWWRCSDRSTDCGESRRPARRSHRQSIAPPVFRFFRFMGQQTSRPPTCSPMSTCSSTTFRMLAHALTLLRGRWRSRPMPRGVAASRSSSAIARCQFVAIAWPAACSIPHTDHSSGSIRSHCDTDSRRVNCCGISCARSRSTPPSASCQCRVGAAACGTTKPGCRGSRRRPTSGRSTPHCCIRAPCSWKART